MIKATTIKQYFDKNGEHVIEVHCDICRFCPCEHIEMSVAGIIMKPLVPWHVRGHQIEKEIQID